MKKLPRAKNAAAVQVLLKQQGYKCPLCGGSLRATSNKDAVLDHDHKHGHVRDALCRNCNGIEGRVFSLARRAKHELTELEWIENLVAYLTRHQTAQHGLVHHTHKTADELRLARNAKARKRAAKLRAMKK